MKNSASHGGVPSPARLPVLALIVGLSLPVLLLGGCPGQLGETWPQPLMGTGGAPGTGGAGPGTGGAPAPACDAPTKIFGPKLCSITGCHGPGMAPLDLSGADPFANLAGKTAMQGAGCVDMPYVSAGNPPGGALMKRISGESCGQRMPPGTPLSADEINCVASWLSSKL